MKNKIVGLVLFIFIFFSLFLPLVNAVSVPTVYTYLNGSGTNFTVYVYNQTGDANWTTPAGVTSVDYLVVAGGGGGGSSTGGGGGAGGLLTGTLAVITAYTYPITVGNGGLGGTGTSSSSTQGKNGEPSNFSNVTATGGGGGGSNYVNINGLNGGSGGGASFGSSPGINGSGTAGQGYNGGTVQPNAWPSGNLYATGGGGGAGGVGANGATSGTTGSAGGVGVQSSISGSNSWYAAGGGGGAYVLNGAGTSGSGGSGIGGNGSVGPTSWVDATNGSANTGSGGGGQGGNVANRAGSGGSGIVIIRYITPAGGGGDNPPSVTLSYPAASYINSTSQYVNITFNASVTDDYSLANCSLWHNATGTWQLNQTQTITGTSNVTNFTLNNLNNVSFIWNIKCFDNASQSAFASANRTVVLNYSDTIYPLFSNNLTNIANGSQYNPSNTYQFNITIINSNGTAGIEFNNVNYSLSNISNSYYWNSGNIAAGTYNYYFWSYGNGTSHNYNISQTYSYTVSKNNSYSLGLTATTPIIYGTATDFTGSGCPTQLTCSLNISNSVYSAGSINANYSTNGNANYSSASAVFSVTINKAVPVGSLTNAASWTITYPTSVAIGLSESNLGDGDVSYKIYRNDVDKGTGETITLGAGVYNYVLNATEGQNYTSNSSMDMKTLNVNKNTSTQVSLTFDKTSPQSYPNSITPTCSVVTGQGTSILSVNGTTITSGIPTTLGVGIWTFNCSLADNGNYSYAENITTFQITQNNSYSLSLDINPSWNVNYETQTNVSGSGCPSQLTCNLYNNFSGLVSNSVNVTLGVGSYNYTYNTTGNENYSAMSVSNILTISQANGYVNLSLNNIENNLTMQYPQQTNITASTPYGNLNIYKDGININSINGINQTYGVGYYNITSISSGNENYTGSYKTFWLNVTKATPTLIFLANSGTSNLTLTYPQQVNISAVSDTGIIALEKDGINYLSYNGLNVTLGAGSYIFKANITGNQNYSDVSYSYYNITISKGSSLVYTYLNNSRNNITITAGTSIDINSSLMSGEGIIKLYVNGSLINSGNSLHNLTLFSNTGLFNITTIYEDTQNYSASNEMFFVNVTDLIPPLIYYNNGTEINGSNLNRNNIVVNVTASDFESGLKNITIFLYNSSGLINSSNSTSSPLFANFTNLTDGTYYFNVTAFDNAGNKNETDTRTVYIDTVVPSLILLSPSTNLVDTDGNITFVYNVTDINNITNCSLILNNEINLTNFSITKGINNSFQLNNLEAGKYNWSINCFDNAGNTNVSETRSFIVILMEEFLGNTTDILNVNISNITNFILDSPSYGKINFSQEIDLSRGGDINHNVNIGFNRIEINSSALPQLNKSARLSLYNLTFSNPRLLKDGNVCSEPICVKENYSSGTLTFNVTGFSVYSAEETPIILEPPSGGGGGSGGGAIRQECFKDSDCNKSYSCFNNKCVKLFDIKIIRIDSPIQPGDFLDFSYYMKGMAEIKGDVIINFWLEKDNKTITTAQDTIYFGSFEEKTETTNMFLSSDIPEGTYTFYVQTDYQGHITSSHRDIQVVKNPTSNLDVNLLSFPSIKEGQAINFSYLVGFNKDSPVLVKLNEKIKKGEEVVWENNKEMEVNRSVIINEQTGLLKSGDYRFEINAEYENKELKFLYDFSVGKKLSYWLFLLSIPIILLLIVFIIWRRKVKKKQAKLEEVLKQIEEKQITGEIKATETKEELKTEKEIKMEQTTKEIQETAPNSEQEKLTEISEQPADTENVSQEQTIEQSSEEGAEEVSREKPFYQSLTPNLNKEEEEEETKEEQEDRLNKVIGIAVYSDDEKIGVVEDVYIEDSGAYKLLVKLEEYMAKESGHEKILIKSKYVIAIRDIIIADERVAEHLRNFNNS